MKLRIALLVAAGLALVILANARLVQVAMSSQPACVAKDHAAYGAAQPSC